MTVALLLVLAPLTLGSMYRLQYQVQTLAAMDRQQRLQSQVRHHLAQAVAVARGLPANAVAADMHWQVTPLRAAASTTTTTHYFQLRASAGDTDAGMRVEALYCPDLRPAVRMLRFVR